MQSKPLAAGSGPRPRAALALLLLALALAASPAGAQAAGSAAAPPVIPRDLVVRTIDGRSAVLADLWREQPLLVTLYYTRCSGICVPYLLSLGRIANAATDTERPYRILAISFDPEDSLDDVRAHTEALGLAAKPGWSFGVADAAGVRALAAAFGFWYRFDRELGQYDHQAMTAAIIDGRLVRVLPGNPVNPRAFRELLWELRGNYVPTYTLPSGEALGSCLDYDPVTGEMHLGRGLLLLVLPALLALLLSAGVFEGYGRISAGWWRAPGSRRSAWR